MERLLEKYREGTLSDEERNELNQLTNRDEVMEAASQRARGIQNRTRFSIGLAALVLVAGGAVWSLQPTSNKAPMLAETVVPETPPEPETVEEEAVPMTVPQRPHTENAVKSAPKAVATAPKPAAMDEPVVICNNQCEADSVISDIWKFLTV